MKQLTSRQKEIVAAALNIINDHGLEELTTKRIAARIGFSDAALYRHFRNKAAILSAMVDGFAAASILKLNEIGAGSNSGPAQIKQFFLDRCRTFTVDRALATIMFAEDLFKNDPVLAAKIHGVMKDHRRLLLKSIRRGQRQGLIKPLAAEHLFTIIMGSLRLLVLQWQVGGYDFDLQRAAEKLWRSLEELVSINKRSFS